MKRVKVWLGGAAVGLGYGLTGYLLGLLAKALVHTWWGWLVLFATFLFALDNITTRLAQAYRIVRRGMQAREATRLARASMQPPLPVSDSEDEVVARQFDFMTRNIDMDVVVASARKAGKLAAIRAYIRAHEQAGCTVSVVEADDLPVRAYHEGVCLFKRRRPVRHG